MAIVSTVNYAGDSPTLQWATQDSDIFNRTHIANLAQVFEAHRHGGPVRLDGLSVLNLNTGTALAQNGDVRIQTTMSWQDTSAAQHSAAALDLANAFTGANTFAGTSTFTAAVDASGASTFKVPVSAGAAPTTNGVVAYDSTANLYKAGANGTTTTLGAAAPTGAMMAYAAGTTDPTGWFLCDGRSVSTTTYAALFAVTGSAYGGSGGSFNIPDQRSRVVMGADSMGTAAGAAGRTSTNNALGNTSGEDTHLLTAAESGVPAHNHPHSHAGANGSGFTDPSASVGAPAGVTNAFPDGNAGTTASDSTLNATASAASAHNNRQLGQIANWIIKQ